MPPFTFRSELKGSLWAGRFVVTGLFTPPYAALAQRLRASCEAFALPHVLYEVEAVHKSISVRGSGPASATKASLISFVLGAHRRPVLYMDVDCVFRQPPELIARLLAQGHDFAIYNWLAEEYTDAFQPLPVEVDGPNGETIVARNRYFAFTHGMDHFDPAQLMCSGPVQLYADTAAARRLLGLWQETITKLDGCADDHCMDYAFNNRAAELAGLRPAWLPKAYARYAWWIYAEPVIDHPEFPDPATHFPPIPETPQRKRYYPERAAKREVRLLPRDCIIDVRGKRLLRPSGGELSEVGRTAIDFWV
jgi:hypothetical protein